METELFMNRLAVGAVIIILLAVFAIIFGWRSPRWLQRRRNLRRFILVVSALMVIVVLPLGVGAFWYNHRPLPADEQRALFPGVEYIRDVRPDVPLVIHVVRIDLQTPGLRFLVTPRTPTEGRDQRARTTSQFLREFDMQIAVNGDGFRPWIDNNPLDFFPQVGDPVDALGFAASEGDVYQFQHRDNLPAVFFDADGRVSFDTPSFEMSPSPYNAVSGKDMLLADGAKLEYRETPTHHPRTALGVDLDERTLILIVVDGRQPNYSIGVTLPDLADIALEYGAWDAINLDGGGSSALVIEGTNGEPVVVNSPIHTRIPGRERPIANHLGIALGI